MPAIVVDVSQATLDALLRYGGSRSPEQIIAIAAQATAAELTMLFSGPNSGGLANDRDSRFTVIGSIGP